MVGEMYGELQLFHVIIVGDVREMSFRTGPRMLSWNIHRESTLHVCNFGRIFSRGQVSVSSVESDQIAVRLANGA